MSATAIAATATATPLPHFDNEQSWFGPDLQHSRDWIHQFTPAEVAEIDAAVHQAETVDDIIDIKRCDFPVPSLEPLLQRVRRETLHGRGFMLLRGIPVERYTQRQSAVAYWGLGLYLGEPVSQNGQGHVLGHVTNLGLDYADPEVRGYQTSARLNYHADSSDLVALLCLRASKSGGLSSIASSTTLWNEMARTRPDHARTLLAPLYYTRWGEIPEGKKAYAEINVFTPHQGRMIASYVRSSINKSQTLPSVPRLTPQQIEAMNHLDALAAEPRIHLDMEFRPGDIQVLCNHSILHSRTAYEDWPEVEKRRHLLRLWLACDDGPALPQFMTDRFQGLTAGGRPDGIRVPGSRLVAPLQVV